MFNQESLDSVRKAGTDTSRKLRGGLTAPMYDQYAFAKIPDTLRRLLLGGDYSTIPFGPSPSLLDEEYDAIVLFFIDAFGWRFVERYQDHPFLRRIFDLGLVNVISSQFPSTTAAHVTTIHTGLPVGESGIYEWTYYEPLLDEIIAPLLYSFAGDEDRNTLVSTGIRPEQLFPTRTLYEEFARHGVRSVLIQDSRYIHSPYTDAISSAASVVGYKSLPQAVATLYEKLHSQRERTYYFLYYDKIDAVCHEHGPNSLQLHAEITIFLDTMEMIFEEEMRDVAGKTLFLMTADHAQVEVDPATTFYLNHRIPELLPLLKTNRKGRILAPAGSPRDLFLMVREEHRSEALELLRNRLSGIAEVLPTSDLLGKGFFGPHNSQQFLDRLADLVILPFAGESVWWYEKGRYEQKFFGHHGGLTPQEMETVLLAMPYGL